jgi:hypothetical protein
MVHVFLAPAKHEEVEVQWPTTASGSQIRAVLAVSASRDPSPR